MELTLTVYDRLRLYTKSYIAPYHEQVVNLLYQPIIGIKATNLYLTLWSFLQIEKKELMMSHSQLLTFFDFEITEFESIRNRLEAIDLLNVYYSPQEGYYLYELRQPLTSQQFFRDSNLNVHLLYKVGYNLYEYLENKFLVPNSKKGLTNITKTFNEVFPVMEQVSTIDSGEHAYIVNTPSQLKVPLHYEFDYELFLALLKKSFVASNVIDSKTKERILAEAALYQFDAQMMSKIVLEAVDNEGQLTEEKLHEVASVYYKRLKTKTTQTEIKPAMTEEEYNKESNSRLNEQDDLRKIALRNYKTKTPHEWLRILQKHTEVPNSYLEVVRVLFDDYHLSSEVINVLIEFVRNRTDGRLPLEYCKTVASNWVYKNVKTAETAMEEIDKITLAEKNIEKQGQVAPTYVKRGKKGFVASEPKWLKEHEDYRKNAKDEVEEVDVDALQQLLSSFK